MVPEVAMRRFDMVMPVELIAAIDRARGDASRALFVRRAVESALDYRERLATAGDEPRPGARTSPAPAPFRPSTCEHRFEIVGQSSTAHPSRVACEKCGEVREDTLPHPPLSRADAFRQARPKGKS